MSEVSDITDSKSQLILRSLLTNEKFMRKVIPFMDPAYFEGVEKELFKLYVKYVAKYNNQPSQQSLRLAIDESEANLSEDGYRAAVDMLPILFSTPKVDDDWLVDEAEKWCQDRALFNAVMESITIIDGNHATLSKSALPDVLSKALSVTFDTNIGHDYIDNALDRYEFYHEKEERIPFDLTYFNYITNGGLPNKSLSVVLAGTGSGKSLFMCHCAASALSQSKNVLYITMEMAEERIAERIDANLLDLPIDQISNLSKEMFSNRVANIASKTNGKLIIKEYPTGQAHSGHFRALLNELKLKKKFTPDMIFIDYMNICSSSRMKSMGGSINSYTYIKSIAEELRGLAVEFNVPLVTATQMTRAGYGNSDPGMEDTSESFGVPSTADLMFALVSNDEMVKLNRILVKQLKNRYNDPNHNKKFVVGVDRSKMKLYDVSDSEQNDYVSDGTSDTRGDDDGPVFDSTPTGKRIQTQGFKM